MTDDQTRIEISLEDLRHLFDLAVDTPLVCSGSFESIDVDLLRTIATKIGVDPAGITPDEFIAQYPHAFVPRVVRAEAMRVGYYVNALGTPVAPDVDTRPGFRPPGTHFAVRDETGAEIVARVAEERADKTCHAGTHGRECGKPVDDPIHPRSEATS